MGQFLAKIQILRILLLHFGLQPLVNAIRCYECSTVKIKNIFGIFYQFSWIYGQKFIKNIFWNFNETSVLWPKNNLKLEKIEIYSCYFWQNKIFWSDLILWKQRKFISKILTKKWEKNCQKKIYEENQI